MEGSRLVTADKVYPLRQVRPEPRVVEIPGVPCTLEEALGPFSAEARNELQRELQEIAEAERRAYINAARCFIGCR